MKMTIKKKSPIEKIMRFLPEDLIQKQVIKEWNAKTKLLNKLPETKNKIKSLKTQMTKTIKYKEKPVNYYLEQLETQTTQPNQEQLQFIKWFQKEYPKISFEQIVGKPFQEQPTKKRRLGLF